jgi:uncharacterized damage-inducible protein DinB
MEATNSTQEGRQPESCPEAVAIGQELRLVVDGGAWHGPALFELLADVSPTTAAARPAPGAHSIWELVLHIAGWTEVVLRRLDGVAAEEPPAGDFPKSPAPSEGEWDAARKGLRAALEQLTARLAALREEDLEATAPGRDYDARFMLRGLVNHVVYHSGQIGLLKKLSR